MFGEWLRAELAQRNMNMSDLAARTGTNSGTVSRWVRGQRRPDPESARRIAVVLGLPERFVLAELGYRDFQDERRDTLRRELAELEREHSQTSKRLDQLANKITALQEELWRFEQYPRAEEELQADIEHVLDAHAVPERLRSEIHSYIQYLVETEMDDRLTAKMRKPGDGDPPSTSSAPG